MEIGSAGRSGSFSWPRALSDQIANALSSHAPSPPLSDVSVNRGEEDLNTFVNGDRWLPNFLAAATKQWGVRLQFRAPTYL